MTGPQPDPAPPPTFDILPLSAELRQAIEDLGYTHPTPVQREVFEPAQRGRDLVVQARTGTGKTAAFGMPIVDGLVKKSSDVVQALVLCPTRELALQVTREVESLGRHRGVKVVAIYGGAPMPRQIQQIEDGAQVVVGTPGRVLDHLRRGTLSADSIRVFVLDESDEMLSMGFLPQINDIMSFLPETRQTLLFSATLPSDIVRMAETRLKSPEFITLSGDQVGALEIDHFVYLSLGDKIADFLQVIDIENPESAIVFTNTRDDTKRVSAALQQQGYAADWLNADLAQNDRERVMAATRNGELRFLVATDVAARGIDISHLTHVINFDFPESMESYVHRTGRTGRAGRTGTAISMLGPSDLGNLYLLRLTYKIAPIEKQLPSARELKTRAETDLVGMFASVFATRPVHPDDLALARRLLTHDQAETIVAGLLRDHLGARPEAAEEATAARRSKAPPPVRPERSERTARAERPARSPRPERDAAERPRERDAAERPRERDAAERPRERDVVEAARADRGDDGGRERRPDESNGAQGGRPRRARRTRSDALRLDDAPVGYTVSDAPDAALAPAPRAPAGPPPRDADHAEVFVNVGRKDGAEASDFQALLEERGVAADATDYVNVRFRHSFIGVRRDALERAIEALNGATIAGRVALAEEARARA